MKAKHIIILAFLIAGVALVSLNIGKNASKQALAVGLDAPDVDLKDPATGKKLAMNDLKGKVLFINFWATWCPPCREEIPSIDALYKEFKGNSNFQMVTILYKDSIQNSIDYQKSVGAGFPVFLDEDGKTAVKYGVTGVPETYVVNKKGVLKRRVIGPADWNSPEEKAFINTLLNE